MYAQICNQKVTFAQVQTPNYNIYIYIYICMLGTRQNAPSFDYCQAAVAIPLCFTYHPVNVNHMCVGGYCGLDPDEILNATLVEKHKKFNLECSLNTSNLALSD